MNNLIRNLMIFFSCVPMVYGGKVLLVVDKQYYDNPLADAKNKIAAYANCVTQYDGNPVKVIADFVPTAAAELDRCAELWNRLADEYQADKTVEGAVLLGNLPIPTFFDPATECGITGQGSLKSTSAYRRAQRVTINENMTIFCLSIYHDKPATSGGKMMLAIYENSKSNTPDNLLAVTQVTPINQASGWQSVALTSPLKVDRARYPILWFAWIFSTNPGTYYANGSSGYAGTSVAWVEGGDNMPAVFGTSTITSTYNFSIKAYYYKWTNNAYYSRTLPSDYVYMDVCDQSQMKYAKLLQLVPDDGGVWPTMSETDAQGKTTSYFMRRAGTYAGDGKADIWISRIYAKNLQALRMPGDQWGDFMEEHEIYDRYLQKVIDRMTLPATVPQRSFAFGAPFSGDWTPEGNLANLKNLFSRVPESTVPVYNNNIIYFPYPQNTPSNLQALFQAGPYGRETEGAAGGKIFSNCKTDSRFPAYQGDTRGFAWACLYLHSSPTAHLFTGSESYNPDLKVKKDSEFGTFNSVQVIEPWHYVNVNDGDGFTGGGCQKDYFITFESDLIPEVPGKDLTGPLNPSIYYNFEINTGGDFQAHCYVPPSVTNELGKVYIHVWLKGAYFDPKHSPNDTDHMEYEIIPVSVGGWANLFDGWKTIHLNTGATSFKMQIAICPIYIDRVAPDKVVVGDAVRITQNSTPQNFWYTDNPPDMHKMANNDWKARRGFTSMLDDGGPSKCHFFALECCDPNNFLENNCLGNMYALGDNGLISYGRITVNWQLSDMQPRLFSGLNAGKCFGMAYLDVVNVDGYGFPNLSSTVLTLLGAGTLKAQPYKPYLDCKNDVAFSGTADTKKAYWCGNNVTVQNLTVPYNANVPELKIYAGGAEIRIKPETHIYYGCEALFKLDPSLKP